MSRRCAPACTLEELIAFLDFACLRGGEDDTDLQRIETERRKVQIMTMHAAKGLEFPVVFLAGGFTEKAGGKGYPSYTTHEWARVCLRQEQRGETPGSGRSRCRTIAACITWR